ncbi:hypothetical protein Pmani_036810 [Petrolisthes manimaculis]|uniref:Uncharacterized protein n=1 Tax=Petrolisthes manimaculis TaxID=1843537 RepID=A0AAE1NJ26_9EUCA|nr:hypothetical protein Pmani_036810 [Petrolisthes manimaculis]
MLVILRSYYFIADGRGRIRTVEIMARASGLPPRQSLIRLPAGVHRVCTCPAANGTRSRRIRLVRRPVRAKRRSDPSNPPPGSRDGS